MAETAAFIYDPSAMESLKTDLTKIRTEAQNSLKELQAQKTLAETTLAEAESTYNKELAVYEAAMAKYRVALAAYEEAMKSYESAMESFTEAMKNYKAPTPPNPCPKGWTPPSPPSPPSPPTPPVEPTPPSPDAMNAAKAALAAVNESIAQVQSDIECLNTLVDTITTISNQVMDTDKEAVHLLTNDFFKLWEFSGMQATGNDVANAIVNNAKAIKDGFDYIDTDDGRLYLDLFDDEKLSMPQCINLGKTIGTTALIALMQQKGWGAEAIYHAAHTIDSSVEYNQVKGIYNDFANTNRQSPVHTDKSSTAQINNAMGAMDEDVTVFIDGKVIPQSLDDLGIDVSKLIFGINSDVKSAETTTDANAFTVVPDNDPNAGKNGYITQSEYNRLLYIITHESGTTDNAATDLFATASALLNSFEAAGYYGGYSSIKAKLDAFEDKNAQYGLFDSNDGAAADVQDLGRQVLDLVLNGTRLMGVNCWTGDGTNAYFSSTYKESVKDNTAAHRAGLI